MNFLLDTNVISEPRKRQPNPNVVRWLKANSVGQMFISSITIAEISMGRYKATDKAVEEALTAWLEYRIKPRYAGQILPITSQIAEVWGQLFSSRSVTQESGLVFDLFLAATAMVHDLSLVTRNTKHFDSLLIHIINP